MSIWTGLRPYAAAHWKLLGHTKSATTGRYAHLADDPPRAANDRISEELTKALGGCEPGLPENRRLLAADRALAGVIRYIEQEASELPPRTGVLVEAKKQPPIEPEVSQRIRAISEETFAKIEPVFRESQAA